MKFLIKTVLTAFICLATILPAWAQDENRVGREKIVFEGDSAYTHVIVRQVGDERCLLSGAKTQKRETCMDMRNPEVSVLEYTAQMFVGFLFKPDTKKAALIGLGGGYIPLVFRKSLPGVRLDVVEIDPLVDKTARKYFGFQETDNIRVTIDDGRRFIKKTAETYDQIWLDAFNQDYVPAHMTTREFLELTKKKLAPDGVVVSNIHNTNQLFDAQVATFRAAFKYVYLFVGVKSGNYIVVASDQFKAIPDNFKAQVAHFGGRIGTVDLAAEAAKVDPNVEVRPAKILTDDYSPANLLNQRK